MKSYYELFNCAKDADKRDIKRAFHALAKKLHPDVSRDSRTFVEVLKAYETLVDDEKRAVYNITLLKLPGQLKLPKERVSFALSLSDVAQLRLPSRTGRRRKSWNPKGYHVRVSLTRAELAGGSIAEIGLPAHVVCPSCGGNRVHCNLCSFRGFVLKAVPVSVPIPRHLSHGDIFAFPLRTLKNKTYAYFMLDTLYLKVMLFRETAL
jgi:DnaJ-class molecular chaperone